MLVHEKTCMIPKFHLLIGLQEQMKPLLRIVHYVNGEAHLNPILRKPVTMSDIKQAVHPHMMDRDLK